MICLIVLSSIVSFVDFILTCMFDCTISFSWLNVRGLKDIVKRKTLFLFCKGQKVHCWFWQETHSSDEDELLDKCGVIKYCSAMGAIGLLVLLFV